MMDNTPQLPIQYAENAEPPKIRSRAEIIDAVQRIQAMHEAGLLGGAVMPEDANPQLPLDSIDNYHYFTLPMALNYQRNSYALWKAAEKTYRDPECRVVFQPREAITLSDDVLRSFLLKHGLALQPNNHSKIWRRISSSIVDLLDGDIRKLFSRMEGSVPLIMKYVQEEHGGGFPYLKGPKICNYWMYVMGRYTNAALRQKEALSVAPDTHVIQASVRLGLIEREVLQTDSQRRRVGCA